MKHLIILLIMVSITMLSCTTTDCSNGIQDGTETGIDCGGDCMACPPAPTAMETQLFGTWYLFSTTLGPSTVYHTDSDCKVELTSTMASSTHYKCYGSVAPYGCQYPIESQWKVSSTNLFDDYWAINIVGDSLHLSNTDGTEVLTYYK